MRRALPLLLLSAATSCAAASAPPERAYSWVWILTGPRDAEVQGEARAAAFAGHFANMDRLAQEGSLLVAGPMAEPRASPEHRGIFILRQPELAAARAVAATDPTTQAGIFRLEVEPFLTAAPLAAVPARHDAAVAASGLAEPPMGYHCRSYVLLTGVPAATAARELRGAPAVLVAGRLPQRDAAVFWLDCESADAAQDLLRDHRASGVAWTVIPWFGTAEIAGLAGR